MNSSSFFFNADVRKTQEKLRDSECSQCLYIFVNPATDLSMRCSGEDEDKRNSCNISTANILYKKTAKTPTCRR